ncbi:hypothetical protein L2724_06975 [Limosilactobacillus vaginalis]|uniref:Phage gp6-like head-tail connector protein n=1 Tax=Limosilactobacillus vaginalis TaxID=1633 RepID=A0AAW5WUB5_9LACO|nr:hypothetical protein [Limosilactobacillus vaginalis]MCZ3668022.1 hypothetical protein [Limosilactobacillus vaginalis]
MAYPARLTYSEYSDLGYTELKSPSDFDLAEKQAQRAIDGVIDYYYNDHDISQDKNLKRVDAYKAAICEQIDFIAETGITSSYVNGDDFNSISIGRLSLQPTNHASTNGMIHGVCREAYRLLAHYGLLYRGRGSDWYVATHS